MPLIAPFQRWLLRQFVEGREFVHVVDAGPARGLRYPVRLPDDKQIWTGTYELEFATALATRVQRGTICFDIGAWHGFHAGVMALAGAQRVCIFEPLPANCARIRRLVELNPALPMELFPVAVGQSPGTAQFEVMPETSMGKIAGSPFQQNERGQAVLDVRVVSLDSLVELGGVSAPALIKIDVEGAEMMVLQGAERTLKANRPRLFIEAHSSGLRDQVETFLTGLRYRVRALHEMKPNERHAESGVSHVYAEPDGDMRDRHG